MASRQLFSRLAAAVALGTRTMATDATGNSSRLAGKGAIVTGGGTGIGRGVALALAAEGCDVIITGRRTAPLEGTVQEATSRGLKGSVFSVSADAAEQDQTPLLRKALATFGGKLDILVNNAGINIPNRSLQDISIEDWHQVINININGTFHLVHAVLPQMRAQNDGLIVNITSIAGKRTISTLAGSSYCASKFAMNSLGEAINLEEYENGIRCTNICPGEVATEILDKRAEPPPPEARSNMLQPEDIGAAVLMVACLPPRAHVTEIIMTGKTTVEQSI